MKKLSLRGLLVFALVSVLSAPGIAGATPPMFTTREVAGGPASQFDPEIDGEWLVHTSATPLVPGTYSSVVVRNLHTGSALTLGGGDLFNQRKADVSAGVIVYEDYSAGNADIRLYDPALAFEGPLAATAADETMPRISGSLVAWYDASDGRVHYRDRARGVSGTVPDSANVNLLDVDRGRIFWAATVSPPRVYVFEPGLDTTTSHAIYTPGVAMNILSLQAHGDWFALTTEVTGSETARQLNTRKSGLSGWAITPGTNSSVFHDDMATELFASPAIAFLRYGETEPIYAANTADDETDPSMYGHRIAYERWVGIADSDIYIATATAEVSRTAGTDRYRTAVEASKAYFVAADTAILCTGQNFPDALAAGPYARLLHAPLLLTTPGAVPSFVMDELERLNVSNVVIIGGPDVVSSAVETQLSAATISTKRVYGDDRYETSVSIANEMHATLQGLFKFKRAFFTRGDNFPDALAVGPVAAGAMAPIILVQSNSVPAAVVGAFTTIDIESGYIVGGTDVVSNAVRDRLEDLMQANGGDQYPIERWSGTDRYATAVAVINGGLEAKWIDLDTLGVATGANFPDALGGGAALGNYGSPLLLVGSSVSTPVNAWLDANGFGVGRVDVFGGSDVVSDSVKNAIAAKLQ